MEKDHVTFVVQASGIDRPLPEPVFLAGLQTVGGYRTLVVMTPRSGTFRQVTKYTLGNAPMAAAEAKIVAAGVADSLYQFLVRSVGVQGTLEESTGP